jgi:hypothetical protein
MKMKRILLFFLLITGCGSYDIYGQKFEMGVGLNYDYNSIKLNENFYHNHLDIDLDTLQIRFDQINIRPSLVFPVYFRYRFKNGFFTELTFETKRLELEIEGNSTYSDGSLHYLTEYEINNAFNGYTGALTYDEFYTQFYNSFFQRERDYWREDLSYSQRVSTHYIHLNGGYTFSQRNEYKPYVNFGLGIFLENPKSSFKKLDYNNQFSDNNFELYKKMPEFTNFAFVWNLGMGVEFYKMRLFTSFHFATGPFLSKLNFRRIDPVNSEKPFSTSYPYNLFSQIRVGGAINIMDGEKKDKLLQEKLRKAELISLGKYEESIRKFNVVAGLQIPNFNQLKSHFEMNSFKMGVFSERTPIGYITYDTDTIYKAYNYIEFYEYQDTINSNGEADLLIKMESNSLQQISRIFKTPDFYVGGVYNLNKNFNLESRLRYNYFEIDMLMERENRDAILYSELFDSNDNPTAAYYDWMFEDFSTEAAIMRNSYHNISINQNLVYKFRVKQFFEIGGHLGASLNYWAPGKFKKMKNGYNDGKYDEYFHQFWHTDAYNPDIDVDYFKLTDLYDWYYGETDDYITYLDLYNHTGLDRFNGSFNFGVDAYFEKLRVSLYGEIGIGQPTFFYHKYRSFGFGLAYYLVK